MKSFLFKKLCKAFTLAVTVLLCLFVLVGCGEDEAEKKDVISEGVTVSGVKIGGLTKAQAQKALTSHAEFAKDIVLEFECEGVEFTIPASQIELKANVEASVERAYAVGRGKDAKKNKKDIKEAKEYGKPLHMALSYNKDKFVLATSEFVTPVISAIKITAVIGVLTELANIAAIEIIMNLYASIGSKPKIGITIALKIAPI